LSVKYPTKVFLAMKSGNLCAFEDCRKPLTSDGIKSNPSIIGEAAHIYGENPGTDTKAASARYLGGMTEDERNHYNNLLYLCPSCHTKIDKQEEDFPAGKLFKIKQEHEAWVEDRLDKSMSEVSFAELDIAAKAIASGNHSSNGDFIVIPPEEKIKKNELGSESRSYISMGLSRSSEVTKFLSQMSQLDDQFPIRLKDGFKQKYKELKPILSGDSLFMEMLRFSQSGMNDFKQQAASLALLSHMFHLCEVFEK
jgi:HNH endonuclease